MPNFTFAAQDIERIREIIEESQLLQAEEPDGFGSFASFRPSDTMDDWATVPISTPFGAHEHNARTEYDAARRWMNSHFPPENLNDIEPVGLYRFRNGFGFQRDDLISPDVMRELMWEFDDVKDDIHNQDTPMSLNDLLFPNE
jgi:hypothetical protein